MTPSPRSPAVARLWGGTAQVLLAEALVLPSGLLVTLYLTRRLGPEGYGLLVLAATTIAWLEWSLTSLFGRAIVKFISEAADWEPVAAAALRFHLVAGIALAFLLWLMAGPLARFLGEPALTGYLVLFALDIPLFALAHAYRHVLVGVGAFGPRAFAVAGRWVARLVVVLILVELGLSVPGAILGSLAGSLAELWLARRGLGPRRPPLWGGALWPPRAWWAYVLPLSGMALSLRLFERLDLFALKTLGASAALAGLYGAAQSLAWLPGLFALSFTPLLLATLTRQRASGDEAGARLLARHAIRAVWLLVPFAALLAGAAPGLITLALGLPYVPAAPLLVPLLLGAMAMVLLSTTTAILTAAGRPAVSLVLSLPLVPLAWLGHWIVIPRAGPLGAALVTGLLSVAAAGVSLMAVQRQWPLRLPLATPARASAAAVIAFAAGLLWLAPGPWLFPKLLGLSLALILSLLLAREFSLAEMRQLRLWLRHALAGVARRDPLSPPPLDA